MANCKKLIEVALPVKEISAESVRDKSIRHGHISTLHLWWARRPLPVCRAVVFASLVPDPCDENCPQAFRDAVADLLGSGRNPGDPYKPYKDIPYTAAADPMEDNLRNRLLMFIGKFSDTWIHNEQHGKTTPSREQLSDYSLIKWESKNNDRIIGKARKLIWVAHNAEEAISMGLTSPDYPGLAAEFDAAWAAIQAAETALYAAPDRHLDSPDVQAKEKALQDAIESFLERMPRVFDPFAGGGAIPLEAARLGCRTFANDLNPVAHIIEKASLEFPQKYGKPIVYSLAEFEKLYGGETLQTIAPEDLIYKNGQISGVRIANRLAFDVEFYAKKLLAMTEAEIGHLYPADEKGNKPVAYYWARVATGANPSCRAEVPLLKQFYMVNKNTQKIYLSPIIKGKEISFKIEKGICKIEGWNQRASLCCPVCGNITDTKALKEQFKSGKSSERLLVKIIESKDGKEYLLPSKEDFEILKNIPHNQEIPTERMEVGNIRNFNTPGWGIDSYAQIFSPRQLLLMQMLISNLHKTREILQIKETKYVDTIMVILSVLINRISPRQTNLGIWDITRETIAHIFGRQAIPMVFDYPESNPFCSSSGSASNQLDWIIRFIESESTHPFFVNCSNASSGEVNMFSQKALNSVITDPPYYDAIAYADLSDFFYIWHKRALSEIYPFLFAFPKTPKAEECTALKHHHDGIDEKAKKHFEDKLLQIFTSIEKQTDGIVSIMFAHQSTEAWTTLCNSIINAGMNITGSWANETEMTMALKTDMASLTSSVTVACRPSQRQGTGEFRRVRSAIEERVRHQVKYLYELGFRGGDLLTACFGQAVSVFGQYERVEKADGSEVTVEELLEMAREAAFNAIVSDIATDDPTRFYIGWLNLFGFSPAEHDEIRRVTQIGLTIEVNDLLHHHILFRQGNQESLAGYKQRIQANPKLGENQDSFAIDQAHRMMHLFHGAARASLVEFIRLHAPTAQHILWRVLTSLAEVLPKGSEDEKAAAGLLVNQESLLREVKSQPESTTEQMGIEL